MILIEISTLQGNNRYRNFIYTIKKLKKIYTDRITINFKDQLVGGKLLFNICNGCQLHSINPWSTVLLEKLTGSQFVKKFPEDPS